MNLRSKRPAFTLSAKGITRPPNPVSPLSTQHSTISYHALENINRRTAEHGTAEYRSEKHCLISLKTSAVRNSLFDIQNSKQTEFRFKWD
jgi:hypothetical protein